MPRFSANLSYLFTEVDFVERFAAARRAGFEAVEFHFPYAYPPAELAAAAAEAGVAVVLFNLPPGDWAGGERGIATDPERVAEFRAGVETALAYARALSCPRINCLAGIPRPGVPDAMLRETLVANLAFAARACEAAGTTLLAESINTRTVPGFYLSTFSQFLDLQQAVAASNFLAQYDVFHMQIMGGDLAHSLATHVAQIGHVQIADVPGRHEPGTGEVNFRFLFDRLDRLGYEGWVGAEYIPTRRTEDSLGWAARYLKPQPVGSIA